MRAAFLALALTACASAHQPMLVVPPDTATAAPPTIFRGVRIYDAAEAMVTEPMDVVVAGGRVVDVKPAGVIQPREKVEVVEGRGMTLVPGLADLNVQLGENVPPWAAHLADAETQAEALLFSGVTTAVVGDRDVDGESLQRRIAAGRIAGPRLFRGSGQITAEGSHPGVEEDVLLLPFHAKERLEVGSQPLDAARAARKELEYAHTDFVTIDFTAAPAGSRRLGAEALRAAVAEAGEYQKQVYAIAGRGEDAAVAAESGAALLLYTPWLDRMTDEQVDAVASAGIPVVTTLSTWPAILAAYTGEIPDSRLDEAVGEVVEPAASKPAPRGDVADALRGYGENVRHNLERLHDAGVPLLAGSGGGLPGSLPGASLHDELDALVALGLPPMQVLQMATALPVRFLAASASFGVVAPGAYADLLLIRGTPDLSLEPIHDIVGIWQAGRRLERRKPAGAVKNE